MRHDIPESWRSKEASSASTYALPALGTMVGALAGSKVDNPQNKDIAGTLIGGLAGGLGGRALRKPFLENLAKPIRLGRKSYKEGIGVEKEAGMLSNRTLGYGMQALGTVAGAAAGSNFNGYDDNYGTIGGMVAGGILGTKLKGVAHMHIVSPFRQGSAIKANQSAKAPSAPQGPEPTSAKTDVPPTGNSETSKPAASKPGFFSRFGFGKKQNPAGEPPKPAQPTQATQTTQATQAPQTGKPSQPAGAEYSMNNRPSNSAYKNMKNSVDADNAKLQGEDPSYHKFASKLAAFRRW